MFMRLATSDRGANMALVNGARGPGSSPEPLRVAIVEDDVTTRDGLAALIEGTPGYRCVGRYGSVEELLRRPLDRPANVLLLDVNLPGISGAEGVRLIRERWPSTDVLMLTVYADEDKIFESICNGAVGYLLKKTPPARLIDAIREAATGGAPMSPEIARKVVTLFRKTPAAERPAEALTAQELRLLQLLADGHSYQAAAERLAISLNTVRSYIRNVYDKLHVHSKSEAVSKALRSGLIV
jgi:DNA-binding NarL/FixJ family response regulator